MRSNFDINNFRCIKHIRDVSYFGIRFKCSYNQMVGMLGLPHSIEDDKEHNSWFVLNNNDVACTIYDFKTRGNPSNHPDQDEHWHIGSATEKDCELLAEELETELTAKRLNIS